jgi:DNA-directed RNA polymerase subunit RPC12/RpoP
MGEAVPEITQAPGKPYRCPSCGESEWQADYYNAVRQGVRLVAGENGEPVDDDYLGDEETYDDGCIENERYVCLNCDHEIVLGEFRFIPADRVAVRHQREVDSEAVAKIHAMLDGREWSPGADFLDSIAEIIRATGREIRAPE